MKSLSVRTVPLNSLPVIDIAGLRSAEMRVRDTVAERIGAACRVNGFFYVSNHGVPAPLIDAVSQEMKRFFAQPLDKKLAVIKEDQGSRRGYEPFGSQTLDPGTQPDNKEAFDICGEFVGLDEDGYGGDLWLHNLPRFHPVMNDYFDAMMTLSQLVIRGLGRSLDLPDDYFNSFFDDPIALIRLLHYPQQASGADRANMGAGAHTDWGAITLLLQDENSGLQVWDGVDDWIAVPPIAGTYVVNLGDLMARWTNDGYRSTTHRVVNMSNRDRYSVPFFFDGPPDYVVSCLPGCSGPNNPAKYPPVTTRDHTREMTERAITR